MAEDIYASRSRAVVGASVALMVLSTSSVGLRLLSRRMSMASLWWDDYIVCVALVCLDPYSFIYPILSYFSDTRSSPLEPVYAILLVSRVSPQPPKELSFLITHAGVHYDLGKHVQVARPDAVSIFYRLLYTFELLYGNSP